MESLIFYGGIAVAVLIGLFILAALLFRRVVPTNEVHILQTGSKTLSYGKDTDNGNVYYQFPSWVPLLGVSVIVLPVSVFSIRINDYEAYDLERLPFIVDMTAFFRVADSNLSAQRVSDFHDLQTQLRDIIQGSARAILSSRDLSKILQMRSELGEDFTAAVREQLLNWGVEPVKTIELMDIRDSRDSNVISNIMAIKKSAIERQSRVEVANNQKEAKIAEIEATKEADVKLQEAKKAVGLKTVENNREVEISQEQANQQVKEQQKITQEREMEVRRVQEVKQAEIAKDVEITVAEQNKQTLILKSEAEKQQIILNAEADKEKALRAAEALLETKTKEAQGIQAIGEADAEAKRLFELALVSGQIQLAQEIGNNDNYQRYLVEIRKVEANQAVGVEQAKALTAADMKFIINENSIGNGINKVTDLLSSTGGTQLGATLEGLSQSSIGQNLINKFLGGSKPADNATN